MVTHNENSGKEEMGKRILSLFLLMLFLLPMARTASAAGGSAILNSRCTLEWNQGNHFKNAEGWSKTCGFKYMKASEKQEFDERFKELLAPSDTPIVFELFVSDRDDYKSVSMLRKNNLQYGLSDYVKVGIKKVFR